MTRFRTALLAGAALVAAGPALALGAITLDDQPYQQHDGFLKPALGGSAPQGALSTPDVTVTGSIERRSEIDAITLDDQPFQQSDGFLAL